MNLTLDNYFVCVEVTHFLPSTTYERKLSLCSSHYGNHAPGRKHDWKVPQGFCGGALKENGWQVPKDGEEMREIKRE